MAKKVARRVRTSTRKPARKTAARTSDASAAIRRLDAEFMQAAGARDAAALVNAFYAADAALMPPNHPLVTGRTAIQGFLQGLIDGGLTSIKLETRVTASAGPGEAARTPMRCSVTISGAVPRSTSPARAATAGSWASMA